MDKKIVKGIILTVAFVLAITLSAAAQAPNTMLYQGRLTDDIGDPITSSTSVTFYIHESEVTAIYVDSFIRTVIPDDNGVFTVELGPLSAADFDGDKLWLEIRIGGVELTPRQLITSVPYAFSASNIGNNSVDSLKIINFSIKGEDIANNTITGTKIQNNSLTQYDIADEPGLARTYTSSKFISPDSNIVFVDSLTITVPAAGYLLVQSNSYASINGTIIGNIRIAIDTVKRTSFYTTEMVVVGSSGEAISPAETRWYSATVTRCFYISSGRAVNVYLTADRGIDDGSGYLYYNKMYALYIPKSYGTVSFGSATPGTPVNTDAQALTDPGAVTAPGESPQQQYIIDLKPQATDSETEADQTAKENQEQ